MDMALGNGVDGVLGSSSSSVVVEVWGSHLKL